MAKVSDVYKGNDSHVRTVKLRVVLEITNLMRIAQNIWFVRFTRYSYCSKTIKFNFPTEKEKADIIKMMNHLEESHVLMIESCELDC